MKKIFIFFVASLLVTFKVLGQEHSFIAMEYKNGVSNQIFLVNVTDTTIAAIRVNGYITIPNGVGIGTVVPAQNRNNPKAYINRTLINSYPDDYFVDQAFLKRDKENFIIFKKDIYKIYFNPNKKWGMGPYPHNGRIIVSSKPATFNKKKKREFILVGIQDEKQILEWLKQQ